MAPLKYQMMRRSYLFGIFAGWVLWSVLFAITYVVLKTGNARLPESKALRYVINATSVAAMPIAIGGFLYVWGDGAGQPPEWATTMPFSAVVGLVLYGAIGMMAAAIYGRLRRPK